MLNTIKTFLSDCLSEPDGKTFCLVRASFALSTLALLAAQIYSIYEGHPFDPMAFGTGASALIAGSGAGIGFKTKLGSDASDATQKPTE